MSGHSKWASIKHKKAALDSKRGQAFTKIIREITVAARSGGGDPNTNPRLRLAMAKSKEANMPKDNIKNAIMKGTGELPGITYEEISYEGYGPAGVAIMIETVTDNKNRTTAEIRNLLTKKNGNMAGAGSVAWLFAKKGFIVVDKKIIDEEKLMTLALDNGALDMSTETDTYEITTEVKDLENVRKALEDNKIAVQSADITMIPSNSIKITDKAQAQALLSLVSALEEHDDVQNVYANFDIPDEILNELEPAA